MGSLVLNELGREWEGVDYARASAYAAELAARHYENFPVVTRLLPRGLRADFTHIYAFCRWADDLGDEVGDAQRSEQLLEWWREELGRCYAGEPRHAVFVALERTVRKREIPRKPFDDLIDAFVQDQRVRRYETFEQVLDYCTRSANPVGRLVLYVCGYGDEERQRLSDATCTALQLTNFWQDVRRDILERDRIYIPADVAGRHGLDLHTLARAVHFDGEDFQCEGCRHDVPSPGVHALGGAYRATVRELVGMTWPMFEEGRGLWGKLGRSVRPTIKMFTRGGERILRKIERQDFDTLTRRPRLGRLDKAMIVAGALIGWRFGR